MRRDCDGESKNSIDDTNFSAPLMVTIRDGCLTIPILSSIESQCVLGLLKWSPLNLILSLGNRSAGFLVRVAMKNGMIASGTREIPGRSCKELAIIELEMNSILRSPVSNPPGNWRLPMLPAGWRSIHGCSSLRIPERTIWRQHPFLSEESDWRLDAL